MAIYNPNTWQQTPHQPEKLINPFYSVIIFVLPSLMQNEDLKKIIEVNRKKLNLDGGEMFIFEELPQPITREEKKRLFEERGEFLRSQKLVKIKTTIVTDTKNNLPSYHLTQARLKKIVEHSEVDLLTPRPNDPKEKWRKGIIPDIINMYKEMGFIEVDPTEIKDRLRHSRNPPDDLSRAKNGFGIRAKALCGCEIRVDINGTLTTLYSCPDHSSGFPEINLPRKINLPREMKDHPPQIRLGITDLQIHCGDCGSQQQQRVTLIKEGNDKSKVRIEQVCPSCGLLSWEDRWVPKSSLKQ